MIDAAARIALRGPRRGFYVGAVGVRRDGAVVQAHNGIGAHAEARLARKLGRGAVVFVARVLGTRGHRAMAKPCPRCAARLRALGVRRVYYTAGVSEIDTCIPE